MSLTWHLIKKDLRRLRLPLALFSLLIAGKIVFYAAIAGLFQAPDLEWLRRLMSFPEMLLRTLAEPIITYFLVGWMVFEDSPVEPDAHWITRPVSGGQLFLAKLAGATLVLVLWPLVLNLGWLLACGCGGAELGISAADFVAVNFFLVALGLAVAALTDGYGRFTLWSLVGLAVFALLQVILNLGGGAGAGFSRLLAAAAAAGGVALVVAGHQFITRHYRRSLALVCGGVVFMGAVTGLWRWNFTNDGPARLADERPPSAGVGIKLTGPAHYHRMGVKHFAQLPFRIEGVPPAIAIGRLTVTGDWSFAGRPAWTSRADFYNIAWEQEAARRLLGLKATTEGEGVVSLPFSRPLAERATREPADFRARIGIDLFRGEILAELPLREGTAPGGGAYTISHLSSGVLTDRRPMAATTAPPPPVKNGVSFLLTERSARGLRLNTRLGPVAGYYALVNRATGELFRSDPVRSGPEAVCVMNQVKVVCWRLTFLTGAVVAPADLTLAVIWVGDGESLQRELHAEPMEFEPVTEPPEPVVNAAAAPARAVAVPPAALQPCVGVYEIKPGFDLTITLEDGRLMGVAPGKEKTAFVAETPEKFLVPAINGQAEFFKDAAGAVTHLVIRVRDQETVARRKL